MVDSIGSNKISPIAHKRTATDDGKDKSKRKHKHKQATDRSQEEERGNTRVGGNIDERC